MKALLMVLCVASASGPAFGAESGRWVFLSGVTTAQLARSCEMLRSLSELNICSSYALGVFDTMSMNGLICATKGNASSEQAVAIVRKELSEKPEVWDQPPTYVIGQAFKRTFPCR